MRIINKGSEKLGFEGKWKCQTCNCEWEMSSGDEKPESISDRDGFAFHMPCPTCKREVYRAVSSNDVGSH